jgi:hypothetical protein
MEATLVKSASPDLIVHSWKESQGPVANPPVYIPKSYITKMSKGLQVHRGGKLKDVTFYGDPRMGHSGSIAVVGDLKHDDMRAVAIYALEFEDMLIRTIGGRPKNIPYRLRFYADQAEFRKVAVRAGASNAMSYYDPRTRDIVMWFDQTITHNELQGLVAHEFTHAYMDIVFDTTSPLWFAEGMAEYFQHFTWKGDRVDPGALNEIQLEQLRIQDPVPITDFVNLGREAFYGHNFRLLYAEAWTVVHFLFEYEPEMIQELLHRERINVTGLDREWRGHLQAMMKLT